MGPGTGLGRDSEKVLVLGYKWGQVFSVYIILRDFAKQRLTETILWGIQALRKPEFLKNSRRYLKMGLGSHKGISKLHPAQI